MSRRRRQPSSRIATPDTIAGIATRPFAEEDAVLFSFSDRPVQEALHLFREERRDA